MSALGGLLLYLGTRSEALGFLVGAAWTVLMAPAVIDRWRAPFLGCFPGMMLSLMAMHLALQRYAWFVPVLLPLFIMSHFFVQAYLAYFLHRSTRWPAYIVLPLAAGGGEALRAVLGIGNFNFYQAGTFLFHYPVLIQAADLVGSLGLTVMVTIPWALGIELVRARLDAPHGSTAWRLRAGAIASVAVALFLVGYGSYRLSSGSYAAGPRLALVQPALEHGQGKTQDVVRGQQTLTMEHVPAGGADMIVWPENAVLGGFRTEPAYKQTIAWITENKKMPLLFGAGDRDPDGHRPTNSAFMMGTDGEIAGRYDKVVLMPFTERRALPLLERVIPPLARFFSRLTRIAWGVAPNGYPGPGATVMELRAGDRSFSFWTPICYESCYPHLAREARRNGASFFVNLTSEGWLGWSVSNNMMGVNVLRAVENRVGLARDGNTGISAFIAPDGRVEEYLRGMTYGRLRMDPGVLIREVRVGSADLTLYTRIGDVLDWTWPVLCVGIPLVVTVRRRFFAAAARRAPAGA